MNLADNLVGRMAGHFGQRQLPEMKPGRELRRFPARQPRILRREKKREHDGEADEGRGVMADAEFHRFNSLPRENSFWMRWRQIS